MRTPAATLSSAPRRWSSILPLCDIRWCVTRRARRAHGRAGVELADAAVGGVRRLRLSTTGTRSSTQGDPQRQLYDDPRDDLIDKLLAFIADYDQKARPFKWTYAADPLSRNSHTCYSTRAATRCSRRDEGPSENRCLAAGDRSKRNVWIWAAEGYFGLPKSKWPTIAASSVPSGFCARNEFSIVRNLRLVWSAGRGLPSADAPT